jgi:hypothetical protein
MNLPADRSTWAGWHRPHSQAPWRALVEAEGEDEAWRRLLGVVEGGDKCVLPSAKDPNRHDTGPCTWVAM